jgi:hypothetical protein
MWLKTATEDTGSSFPTVTCHREAIEVLQAG